MTNREYFEGLIKEYVERLTNEELANLLSIYTKNCNDCPIKKYCDERPNVFDCEKIWLSWLENELGRRNNERV